jgi:hypothetical protein
MHHKDIKTLQVILYILNRIGPMFESELVRLLYFANKRYYFQHGISLSKFRFSVTNPGFHQEDAYISTLKYDPNYQDYLRADGSHIIALKPEERREISKAAVKCLDWVIKEYKERGNTWLREQSWKLTSWEEEALKCYHSPIMSEIRKEFDTICKEAISLQEDATKYNLFGSLYGVMDSICPDRADSDDDWFIEFSDPRNEEVLRELAISYRNRLSVVKKQIELEKETYELWEAHKKIGERIVSDFWELSNHFEESDG